MARPVIMWFRRDLRIADHAALAAAAASGPVVALFVVDPAFGRAGRARHDALAGALASLHRAVDGCLVIRTGSPSDVVPAVAAEAGAAEVFVTRDANPYGRRRDAEVAGALRGLGATLHGVGWNYAVGPGTVGKPDGTPYAVFTPFARAWRGHLAPARAPTPEPQWRALPGEPLPLPISPGAELSERAVRNRWAAFVGGGLDRYAHDRDRPDVDGTSQMSAALRWGVVHPAALLGDLGQGESSERFATELIWREFYADVLLRHPRSAWSNLNGRMDAMPVDTGPEALAAFDRWRTGTTGFPIIDAGMRQLATTGWMHNRARMLVASFLVKDLHLPWQWGARHFLDHLYDGDLASNNHGWQWCAGTGTDAAPYFRIFNPTTQSRRFDPDGQYIRRYVPELRALSGVIVHEPGLLRPPGYPAPMVDHATERADALARYRHAVTGTR